MGSSTRNARLALGGLLVLGLADLGLINFSLAPQYAEEQAKLAQGGRPPGSSTAQPTALRPTAVPSPSVAVAPPRTTKATPPPETSVSVTPPAPSSAAVAVTEPPKTPTPKEPAPVAPADTSVADILFGLDSNQLTITAKATLDEVLSKLKANSGLRIHVRGHSDQLGSHEHNLELSRRRAAAVENYLLTHGVPASRISTEAVGGSKPADASNTPTAWARNRRVELEWR